MHCLLYMTDRGIHYMDTKSQVWTINSNCDKPFIIINLYQLQMWTKCATAKKSWYWWKLQYCNCCHFYPGINSLRKFLCVSTKILNFRAKINFANMLKIVQKSHKVPDFLANFKHICKFFFCSQIWYPSACAYTP